MAHRVETEREVDGRWIAEVLELPGVMAYGGTEDDAIIEAQTLARRVLAYEGLVYGKPRRLRSL